MEHMNNDNLSVYDIATMLLEDELYEWRERSRLTSVPADGGSRAAANVTPTDEQESLFAAAADDHR